jgi:uncharacterized protein YbbK (DUF523 family)
VSEFPKPNVVVSKCLGFAKCRYDGKIVLDTIVRRLRPFVNFIPVCPEVEIGLGIPRDPIRVVSHKSKLHLYQPATDKDLTKQMIQFSKRYLASLEDVDGFILKSRSPSCGINRVKVYPALARKGGAYNSYGPDARPSAGTGFFARAVKNKFPYLVIVDECRLKNLAFRKSFFIKLFSLARLRTLRRNTKENKHPLNQIFHNPFLQKLIEIPDSRKNRNRE